MQRKLVLALGLILGCQATEAHALLHSPRGDCEIEGKVILDQGRTMIVANYGTDSTLHVDLLPSPSRTSLKEIAGANIRAFVRFESAADAAPAIGTLLRMETLSPFYRVRRYRDNSEITCDTK